MNTALASLSTKLSERFSMGSDSTEIVTVLKATAFKGPATEAQLVALMIVADQFGLNPFTKEIYAFPDKNNGIVPVVGVDGWSRIINDHPQFDGMEFDQDDVSCTCMMYRKDRSRPVKVTEFMAECRRPNVGPWTSHPKRMLRHKAMIQCARLAFGFTGIYDHDEAERVVDGEASRPVKHMGAAEVIKAAESDGYAEYEAETLQFLRDAAIDGTEAMRAAYRSIPKSAHKEKLWTLHGEKLTKAAAESDLVLGEPVTEAENA